MDSLSEFIVKQKKLLAEDKNRLLSFEHQPVELAAEIFENIPPPTTVTPDLTDDEEILRYNEETSSGDAKESRHSGQVEHSDDDRSCKKIESRMPSPERIIAKNTQQNSTDESKNQCMFSDPFVYYNHLMRNSPASDGNKENRSNSDQIKTGRCNVQPLKQHGGNKHNEMEQSETDAFYSHFPSFNEDNTKKLSLSRARQLEYQLYLKNIPEVTSKSKLLKNKYLEFEQEQQQVTNNDTLTKLISKTLDEDDSSKYRKGSPRHKLMQDLKHIDLPTILNSDTVDLKNKLVAEKEAQKKMDYQRELIKQIEEKRREVERLRLKEKQEEELLTKRLEQQLKTIELENELESEKKRTEKIRLANEQNHIRRMQLLSKLQNDHKIYNPYDENRKTLSENGKDKYKSIAEKANDAQIYRYFSNSAKHDKKLTTRLYNRSFDISDNEEEKPHDSSSSSLCKKCLTNSITHTKKRDCIHCGYHEKISPIKNHLCLDCHLNLDKILKFCTNCKELLNENCANCNRSLSDICNNCNSTKDSPIQTIREIPDDDSDKESRRVESPPLSYNTFQRGYAAESDTDFETNSIATPVVVRNHTEPYSINVENRSVFHPKNKVTESKIGVNIRNGEIYVDKIINDDQEEDMEKLKSKLDDRISKYVRNYDDLWRVKKGSPNNIKSNTIPVNKVKVKSIKSYPVTSNADKIEFAKEKSRAMKVLERKWDIPVVQQTIINENASPKVLTQLGAIRKQLQLEQLNMDQTYSTS